MTVNRARRSAVSNSMAGYTVLERLTNPVDKALLFAGLTLAYRTPSLAAVAMVASGASLRTAYAAVNFLALALTMELAELVKGSGLFPGDDGPAIVDSNSFDKNNWPALAKQVGEQVDFEAWRNYAGGVSITDADYGGGISAATIRPAPQA